MEDMEAQVNNVRQRKLFENFLIKARERHGDRFDYSDAVYINSYTPIKIYCPIHGYFYAKPFLHIRGNGCNKCTYEEYAKRKKEASFKFYGDITQDKLKSILLYEKETGIFKWKVGNNQINSGDNAGTINKKGYVRICINQKTYPAHCLAWLYVYGEYPQKQIDHINHDKQDNRIVNLRLVDNLENHKNMPRQKNNTSGVTGVSFRRNANKWVSHIKANGKFIHLGIFNTKEEAINSRKKAEQQYNFYMNHGK